MPHRHATVDETWRSIRAASPAKAVGPKHARLTFLGHATVLIEVDDLRILTDPVLRDGLGPVRRQVKAVLPELFADLDAVFISHGHHDHLDTAFAAQDPRLPTVIVPKGFGRWWARSTSVRSRRWCPATCSLSTAVHFRWWKALTTAVGASHSDRRVSPSAA